MTRRSSAIDRTKRLDLVKRARRMTPQERLETCANLSRATAELRRAGERHRQGQGGPRPVS